jgi:hypothetical protein
MNDGLWRWTGPGWQEYSKDLDPETNFTSDIS